MAGMKELRCRHETGNSPKHHVLTILQVEATPFQLLSNTKDPKGLPRVAILARRLSESGK